MSSALRGALGCSGGERCLMSAAATRVPAGRRLDAEYTEGEGGESSASCGAAGPAPPSSPAASSPCADARCAASLSHSCALLRSGLEQETER